MAIKIEIAKPAAKKIKILFYGPSGCGKTVAGLSFPRALMVDTENGSDLYAGKPGIPEFHRVRIKTMNEMFEVLDAVEKDKGKTWDTLIIDPVTVLYDVEKNVRSANNTKDLGFREWAKVNSSMTALYNRLTALDVHVVVIAREATEYAGEGNNLKKIGVKPEADKKLVSMMDFIIRLKPDHSGETEKSRGVQLGSLPKVNWSVFEPIANAQATGEKQTTESEEEATAKALNEWSKDNVEAWLEKWRGQGMTDAQLQDALGIKGKWSTWKGTVKEADEKVEATRKPEGEVIAAGVVTDVAGFAAGLQKMREAALAGQSTDEGLQEMVAASESIIRDEALPTVEPPVDAPKKDSPFSSSKPEPVTPPMDTDTQAAWDALDQPAQTELVDFAK